MRHPCTVSKCRKYSAKAYRIARRDECQIIAATLAVKVLILVFGIHVFNALEPAAPSRGIGLEVWNRWDSPAYLNIAQHGYTASLPNRVQLVLFPLYPLCVRAVAILARNYLVSAFIVSGIGAAIAAVLLYRLTRRNASRAVAIKAVWLMLIFPSGFFLHIGYPESLFLALAIACLYAAQSDRWAISGLMGALAAMTRINGWLLVPTLATEVVQQFVSCRKWRWQWLWALMPLSGLAVYLLINYKTTGHALAFLTIQREHWSKALDWPWKGIRGSFDLIRFGNPNEAAIRGVEELLFISLGFACTLAAWFTMRAAYATWMTLNWMLFTSVGFILCVPRYTLMMFPIYIVLARIGRHRIAAWILTTWCLLSAGLFIALFVRAWWVS